LPQIDPVTAAGEQYCSVVDRMKQIVTPRTPAEPTRGKSPFTQTIRVALTALRK
jgi:hypothetical protein